LARRTTGAPHDWDAEAQGKCYGLPVRDVVCDGTPYMISAWEPSPAEMKALLAGETIKLWISGTTHPVVAISVGPIE
jgi:hypothetical protein